MQTIAPVLLLNAVVVAGAGAPVPTGRTRLHNFWIEATGITSGGVLKIQTLNPLSGNWSDLDSRSISATGTQIVRIEGAVGSIRANLFSRVDGTFSVFYEASSYE